MAKETKFLWEYAQELSEDLIYKICDAPEVQSSDNVEYVLSEIIVTLSRELSSWLWQNHPSNKEER